MAFAGGQRSNPQLNEQATSQPNEQAAAKLDVDRLKLIDEISRVILELKKEFPELAQSLEKARDNVSISPEMVSAKNLQNILTAIRQNLNDLELKLELKQELKQEFKPELKLELKPELKPEFVETIKNLVNEALKILRPSTEIPPENKFILALSQNDFAKADIAVKNIIENQSQQAEQSVSQATPKTFQIILNTLQELKTLGIPEEFKNTPLKELEAIVLQKTGIEIDKSFAKNLQAIFNEKPAYAVAAEIPVPKNILQIILQAIPQPPPQPNANLAPQLTPQLTPQIIPPKAEMAFSLYQIIAAPSTHNPQPQAPISQPQIPISETQPPIPQPQIPNSEPQTTIPQSQPPSPQTQTPSPQLQIPTPQTQILIPQPQTPISEPQTTSPQQPQTPTPQPQISSSEPRIFILQLWPASVHIPKEERDFWIKTELPLTPQIIELRNTILSFGKLPEEPQMVRQFAENLHEMSLKTENQAPITKEQANLLWRIIQHSASFATPMKEGSFPLSSQLSQLLKYQPQGNHEGELLKTLPEPVKKEILQELPAGKTWQPEMLQKAVEKILEKHNMMPHSTANEEVRQVLQNLKEQIQLTRVDNDTRPQADRENVFYFMHGDELQKGRLKIKDERKGGNKKQSDSSISFSISTHTKILGDVHADLTLTKRVLNISLQDSYGNAGEAVKEERETLAKELADIGISLGQLLYGKTPKIRNLPVNKTEDKSKSGLDLKA